MENPIERAKNKVMASIDKVIGEKSKEIFEKSQKLDFNKLDIQYPPAN